MDFSVLANWFFYVQPFHFVVFGQYCCFRIPGSFKLIILALTVRQNSLKFAYYEGFKTSVSCEPAVDTNTNELVEILLPFVTDAIWIGLPNRLKASLKINGADDPETLERADALIKAQSNDWVKELYRKYHDNPIIKWKDSIKKIVGIDRPIMAGLDI